jgi:signal transduction histidine kinase
LTDNVTRTDQPGRLVALWTVLANWRDWNLPVKLAAVTLVPVVFAVVLGAMQISDQIDKAGSYRRVDRLVVVNSELRSLIESLQRERTAGVELLASRAPDVGPRTANERAATDAAQVGFRRAADRVTLDEEITAASFTDAGKALGQLGEIRKQVGGAKVDPSTALDRYTDVVAALLRFDRSMASEAIDPQLAATTSALFELEVIREQVAFQHALIGAGIVRSGLAGPNLDALRDSASRLADSTTDFYAVAGPERRRAYDESVSGTGIAGRNNVVEVVLATPAGTDVPSSAQEWDDASKLTENRIGEVSALLGRQLRDRSEALQDEASDGAGLAAVILLVALVVAVAVMFVMGRHLLSSLSALRRSALEVAERRLPDAVARIRDRGDDAGPVAVEPVPVTSMDEVGQVARAFDAVQQQALRLATEQAGLRAKYSSVFVNLSRRSQGLVQRQLQLLERLERDEEDAEQLATLFQLDHLATRMRRNNENLMVLSGADVGRRNQKPTSLADLLRAAVSEIEQYQRVVMLPPPNVQIVGYAVGDLVRLTAELLDNATAFSAPDTQVTIASHEFADGSLCIAVLDEGIGMSQAELDEANHKMTDPGAIDVSSSRRMGLFVIGRLASRHDIEVRLNGGQDVTGVRATVTVPADLVSSSGAETPPAVSPPTPPSGLTVFSPNGHGHANGSPVNGAVNGSLNGAVNGSVNGSVNGTARPAPPEAPESTSDSPGALPRRSPGSRMPGPATGSARPPAEDSPGLFKPEPRSPHDTGWWTTTGPGRPVDPRALDETTPIFDEMISAWFRTISDDPHNAPPPPPRDRSGRTPNRSHETRAPQDKHAPRQARGGQPGADAPQAQGARQAQDAPGARQAEEAPGADDAGDGQPGAARRPAGTRHAGDGQDPRVADKARRGAGKSQQPRGADKSRHPSDAHRTDAQPVDAHRADAEPSDTQGGTRPVEAHQGDAYPEEAPDAANHGVAQQGAATRDAAQQGEASQGVANQGAAQQGAASRGAAQQGAASRGAANQGAANLGAAQQSGAQQGAASLNAAQESAAQQGAEAYPAGEGHAGHAGESQPGSEGRPASEAGQTQPDGAWSFAADAGFDAARAVSRVEPESFTEGGLPRRSAGQHLVPGTAGRAGPNDSGPPRHGRAAAEMRDRLSSYRLGIRKARGQRHGADSGAQQYPDAHLQYPTQHPDGQPHYPGAPAQHSDDQPQQYPGASTQDANAQPEAQTQHTTGRPGAQTRHPNGQRSASTQDPTGQPETQTQHTTGQPGARTQRPDGQSGAQTQHLDGQPEAQTQHTTGQPGARTQRPDGQSGAQTQHSDGQRGARTQHPTGQPQQPAAQHPDGQRPGPNQSELELAGPGWQFAADVGWRAANSVSTSTPVSFTTGGLPRRSAGANLVPGSVAPTGGGPLRPNRADEIRGRLGSFQSGLSRGRRSLAERGTANGYPENKQQESE